MTTAVVEVRAGCTAMRHDTASAYKKNGCRCEAARRAETARKAKQSNKRPSRAGMRIEPTHLIGLTRPGVPDWRTDPRRPCSRVDPDLMFAEAPPLVDEARAVCKPCPVSDQCLEWSIEHAIPYGIWGGEHPLHRRQAIRARHRGVPA